MTVPAHLLRASLDDALEIVAAADTAKDLGTGALANVLALPEPHRALLLEVLRECWELNAEMMAAGQRLSSRMDELARLAHRAECEGNIAAGLNVKALAAAMRPHLTVIADGQDITAHVIAVRELRRLIDITPVDRLRGGSMRSALSPGRHALLMQFVNGQAEPRTRQVSRREIVPAAGTAGGEARASTIPSEGARLTTPLGAVA